jgi:peptidyl-prolyl cis-trans isomerase D
MPAQSRRLVTKIATGILFALLIASFALWGIGDIFRGGAGGSTVIQVGEQEVGQQEFARTFQREFNRVRQQIGGDLDLETARQLGLVDQIVRQTVTRLLFDQMAGDMGLRVSDEQVVERLRQQEAFRTAGTFNRQMFEQTLRRSGLTEERYVQLLRSDINRQHLAFAATGGLQIPQGMAEALYRYRNEERIADYVTLRNDSFEVPDPDTQTLREFHEANGDLFMAPEYRKLTLIQMRPEDLLDEVSVSEEELRDAFETRRSDFTQPERRRVRQIVFDSQDQAQQAVDLLSEGRTLDAVAQQLLSRAPADLGMNSRQGLLPALREPAFDLDQGAVSQPIESSLGWHVVKVTEIQQGQAPEFEEVRDQLREELAMDKAVDSLVQLANTLDDELAGGAKLEEAADTVGMPVRTIEQISQQGRTPDGETVENLPQGGEFLSTAFETPDGERSLLRETPEGGYYVVRVDGVTPSQVRPFDEVRDQVAEEWRADQRAQAAEQAAQEMAEAIDGGTPLAELAAGRGLDIANTPPLKRSGNQQAGSAARALAGQLFDVEVGQAVTAGVQGGVAVAQLAEVRPAQPSENAEAVSSLRQQTRQRMRSDVLAQFADALRTRYEVRINQTQLDQVLNRY